MVLITKLNKKHSTKILRVENNYFYVWNFLSASIVIPFYDEHAEFGKQRKEHIEEEEEKKINKANTNLGFQAASCEIMNKKINKRRKEEKRRKTKKNLYILE